MKFCPMEKLDVKCVYCDWRGDIGQCLGGIADPLACPECGCRVEEASKI